MLQPKQPAFYVLCMALLIHAIAAVLSIYYPVSLGLDVFDGFYTYHSFLHHQTPFHHTLQLNPQDISKNTAAFLAWFTPACYLLPHGLSKLLCVHPATAAVLLNFSCFGVGITGFYRLFKQFGFSNTAISLSVILISLQLYTLEQYYTYVTTDIYLFAFMPWLLVYLLRQTAYTWYQPILLLPALLVGFVLKSSFLLMVLPLLLAVPFCYTLTTPNNPLRPWGFIALSNIAVYVVAFFLCHFFFNRYGEHSGYARYFSVHLADIAVALAGPLTSAFSFDKLIDLWANNHLHEQRITGPLQYFYYATALLSLFVFAGCLKKEGRNNLYTTLWGLYTAGVVALTTLLHVTNSGIDTNSRIYFLSGYLLLPQLIEWVKKSPLITKVFLGTTFVMLIATSLSLVIQRKVNIHYNYPYGPATGFKYEYLQNDRQLIPALTTLDRKMQGTNSIIILPTFGLGLELTHLRSITYHERWNLKWWLEQEPLYHGTVAHLYIVSYKHLSTETMPLYLSRFTGYKGYRKISETEAFNVFELTKGQ